MLNMESINTQFVGVWQLRMIMSDKLKGTVKWFKDDKGFGFIQCNGKDYFVHFSGIQTDGFKTLPKGANVLFRAVDGKKGIQAEEVEILS